MTATPKAGRSALALNWLMSSAASFIIGGVALVIAPIVARELDPVGRGRLVTVQLTPQLLADLSSLGLGFAIVHFGSKRTDSIGTLLRWSIRPIIAGSAILMTFGWFLSGTIAGGPDGDDRLLRTYLLICPLVAFSAVLFESLRASGDFKRWNILVIARGLTWPIALVIGVIIPAVPSLQTVIYTHMVLLTLLLGTAFWICRTRTLHHTQAPVADRGTTVRFGLSSALSMIPRSANAKLDQVILAVIILRPELGLYAAAVGWSALTIPALRGLTSVSMPHISSAEGSQRIERITQLVTSGLAAAAILSVLGVLTTWILWEPLYGAQYTEARTTAFILIPAALCLELNATFGNILRSLDRPNIVFAVEASVLAISAALLFIVVTIDPIAGPAGLSLVTYLSVAGLMLVLIGRQVGVPAASFIQGSALGDLVRGLRTRGAANR